MAKYLLSAIPGERASVREIFVAFALLLGGTIAKADTPPVKPYDFITTGTLATAGATLTQSIVGVYEGILSVSGTFSASLNIQCNYPYSSAVTLKTLQTTWVTTAITAPGNYMFRGAVGCPQLEVLFTSYTSGSALVTIDSSFALANPIVSQPNSSNLSAGVWINNSGTQVQGAGDSSGDIFIKVVNPSNSPVPVYFPTNPTVLVTPAPSATFPVNDATTETNTTTIANAQGVSGTGIAFPTGGSGILGWLSGIYKAITGTVTISGNVVTQPSPSSTTTVVFGTIPTVSLSPIPSSTPVPVAQQGPVTVTQGTPGPTPSPWNMTTGANNQGTPTQTSVSCATTSTTLLAANTATKFIHIRNSTTSLTTVWISIVGSTAASSAPSDDIPPGGEADYFASENSYLPTAQINCISAGPSTVPVTLEYK